MEVPAMNDWMVGSTGKCNVSTFGGQGNYFPNELHGLGWQNSRLFMHQAWEGFLDQVLEQNLFNTLCLIKDAGTPLSTSIPSLGHQHRLALPGSWCKGNTT